jgi:dienelactone hydrolase
MSRRAMDDLSRYDRRSALKLSLALSASAVTTLESLPAALSGAFELPEDVRLKGLKDLNGYFPFTPKQSLSDWETRKEFVRRQIQLAAGLWPMPERPPIDATVHGRIERDDYTVDRVLFESSPGLLVTGSLYLPKNATGRLPTVMCPHGHWANGRFHDHGADQLKRELESGGEQFEVGGRHPLQARCVQLARMGCMVFLYDMLGYADGSSFTQALAHGFAKQRPELSSPERWGMFSAQSELRLLNAFGLQTWNSIRTLDWLLSRPDCDASRIGVTGASGGGTQTFILAAIDDRVTAAFPAVMVSTAMQGGCTCENASYLRVNTGNIEFAALVAPRPIAMTGADDWTVEIETKGLPELKQHFTLLGVPGNVDARYMKFPHNYNHPSRMMMYEFFNRTLQLGVTEIVERDFVPLTVEEATVFNAKHPAPARDEEHEVALLQTIDGLWRRPVQELDPSRPEGLAEFRRIIGGALQVMIGRELPVAGSTSVREGVESRTDGLTKREGYIRIGKYEEEVPTVLLVPGNWNREVVLWIDGAGKSQLFESDGRPVPVIRTLTSRGYAVLSADLYLTGDFTADGKPVAEMPVVANPREFAGYTLGYNHPLFSQRVHDVLTLISFAKNHDSQPQQVHLVGVNGAGVIALAAAAVADTVVSSLRADTAGFRFASITKIRDVNLLPGAVKYGDVPALLALCASVPATVAGETAESVPVAVTAYRTAGGSLTFEDAAEPAAAFVRALAGA